MIPQMLSENNLNDFISSTDQPVLAELSDKFAKLRQPFESGLVSDRQARQLESEYRPIRVRGDHWTSKKADDKRRSWVCSLLQLRAGEKPLYQATHAMLPVLRAAYAAPTDGWDNWQRKVLKLNRITAKLLLKDSLLLLARMTTALGTDLARTGLSEDFEKTAADADFENVDEVRMLPEFPLWSDQAFDAEVRHCLLRNLQLEAMRQTAFTVRSVVASSEEACEQAANILKNAGWSAIPVKTDMSAEPGKILRMERPQVRVLSLEGEGDVARLSVALSQTGLAWVEPRSRVSPYVGFCKDLVSPELEKQILNIIRDCGFRATLTQVRSLGIPESDMYHRGWYPVKLNSSGTLAD